VTIAGPPVRLPSVVPRFAIFDLYHTLVHGADEERDRVLARMAETVGVPPAALIAAYHGSWRQRLTGWGTEETVRVLARRAGGDPTPAQVAAAAELRVAFARRVLDAVAPATLTVLDALRAEGWRLGLLSNATADSADAWPRTALAGRFDAPVFSCDIGVGKPDPDSYRTAARRLGARPGQCVYVADGADRELAGAAALGMTVIRTTEHNDSDPAWAGPVVSALTDLPALLQ